MSDSLFTQLKELNRRLSLNQKLSIAALSTVVLCSILSFVYLIQGDGHQLLFSGLDAESAARVTDRLDELGIGYRLSDRGSAVLVPAERIDEARLSLAAEGMPSTGRMGFEIFDQNNWGLTDFAEKINFNRALEAELERTILSLSEISRVRVHLVPEKDALFEEDERPAKASVLIQLRRATALPAPKIAGITNLVASAVEGLEPANVTVVDVSGRLLTENGAGSRIDGTLRELEKEAEAGLAAKVISVLEPLVGKGRVRVSALVELNNSEVTQTEELFDPKQSALVRQLRTDQSSQEETARGIPFKANDGEEEPAATPLQGEKLLQEEVHYEVSKTVRNLIQPRGSVKRVAVAVAVDHKMISETGPDGAVVEKSEPRSVEEMGQIKNLVTGAIGYDQNRGDTLTVENIPFSLSAESLPPPGFLETYPRLVWTGLRYFKLFALFLLFYLFIFRPLRKRVFTYVEVTEPDVKQLESGREVEALAQNSKTEPKALGAGAGEDAQADGTRLVGSPPRSQPPSPEEMGQQVLQLARQEPELVTKLVRAWLAEGA